MEDSFLSDGEPTDLFLANFSEDCQCVVAEIVRLQDFLPDDFCNPAKSRFKELIFDFSYFNQAQQIEENVAGLQDLEEEFYTRFGHVLKRFEILFQTTANLFHGLAEYSELVSKEFYSSADPTREAEADALFHLGSIAYHVHKILSGATRERLFVSIFRISENRKNVEFLVDFLRADAYPYPGTADLSFSRVRIDRVFTQSCLSFLERAVRISDASRLPRIGHRLPETLFGCLLFAADVRATDLLRMKYFVENFFRDFWVISLSLGLCVSVVDEWSRSPAATSVCQNHFVGSRLQQLFREHNDVLQRKEHSPSDIVPEKFDVLIDWIQRVNSSYSWMVLHSGHTVFGKQVLGSPEAVVKFLDRSVDFAVKLASFEMDFLDIYGEYMKERQGTVASSLEEVCSLIDELALLFAANGPSKIERREKLAEWLKLINTTLRGLNLEEYESSSGLIHIRRKLSQVTEMLDLNKNLAVSHFVEMILKKMDALHAAVSISSNGEGKVRSFAQAPYLWPLIDSWVARIQSRLLVSTRTQPVRVLFRKLNLSIADVCATMKTEEKKDLIGRAYSCYLEKRLRNVLQSVPQYLFKLVNEKVSPILQKKWDPVIEKTALKELSDFSENLQLSEVTHSISNMSVGISRMSLKKIGTITVNPKELMEEGIRQELRKELPVILAISEKNYKAKTFDLEETLEKSAAGLSAFHRAFIYLCEHLAIEGHQIWWEEMEEHLGDIDCSLKILPKSGAQPLLSIVYFFILKLTDPSNNSYFPNETVWKERRYSKEVFSSRCSDLIERWVPSLANSVFIKNVIAEMQKLLKEIFAALKSTSVNIPSGGCNDPQSKEFEQLVKDLAYSQLTTGSLIAKVGQLSLVLSVLLQSKQENARIRATILVEAVTSANRSLLCVPDSLPPSTPTVAVLSKKLGIVTSRLHFPMPSHPSPHFAAIILCHFVNSASKFGQKRDSLCEHSFRAGLVVLLAHVQQTTRFIALCRALREAQSRNKRMKCTVEEDVLSRVLCDTQL